MKLFGKEVIVHEELNTKTYSYRVENEEFGITVRGDHQYEENAVLKHIKSTIKVAASGFFVQDLREKLKKAERRQAVAKCLLKTFDK